MIGKRTGLPCKGKAGPFAFSFLSWAPGVKGVKKAGGEGGVEPPS